MIDNARPVIERVAEAAPTGVTTGAVVSGATLFGFDVPVLIQYGTLALVGLQVVWWTAKLVKTYVLKDKGDNDGS